MITSFLASQHTFCYLQLQAEKAKAVKNMNFDEADTDTVLAKVIYLLRIHKSLLLIRKALAYNALCDNNLTFTLLGSGETTR